MPDTAPSESIAERLVLTNAERDYRPIADYGVIGDMHTAALIASDGSIDWVCLPFFDSPAVFFRLLDRRIGGYCAIDLADLRGTSRKYVDGTNILETTFTSASGSLVLTDLMPVDAKQGQGRCRIIRHLRCAAGHVDVRFVCRPTFAFHSAKSNIRFLSQEAARLEAADQSLLVQGPQLKAGKDGALVSTIRLDAGGSAFFALSCALGDRVIDPIDLGAVEAAMEETRRYWTEWAGQLHYEGRYRGEILRSVLLLKLLTFAPTGSIVAAPTTSLPEIVGGSWNWDYRLSWIRDSQFVLTALMHCGYFDEAHSFFRFLKKAAGRNVDQLQILYDIRGDRATAEGELHGVEGYRCSKPVRIGNAAGGQKQSDIYGELLNCIYVYCYMAPDAAGKQERAREMWGLARKLANHVARHWQEPDSGIWELRGGARQYVHSKGMGWTALDRAIRLAAIGGSANDVAKWEQERDAILESINAHGFDTQIGAYVQSYGSDVLDAAVLRLPLHGVIPAHDSRMVSTIEQIERRLQRNGLVMRYAGLDGRSPDEGAFTSCTLWLVNNYLLLGRMEQARETLEHLLSFQNDLGLYSEEIHPETGEQLGNFPQALTHVALVSSILHMEKGARPGALHASHGLKGKDNRGKSQPVIGADERT